MDDARLVSVRAVARVLVVNGAKELLLCRSRSGKAWVPPGGTMDAGESLVMAAAREAMEEVGLPVRVGRMLYLQEFRAAELPEPVIEVAFLAVPLAEQPTAEGRVVAAGPPERPWSAWQIQDLDGPRRLVRWFSRAEVAACADPVYPEFLRAAFWEGGADPYLGLVQAR